MTVSERLAAQKITLDDDSFRLLVETVEEYAIFMLDPTGHVTSWNPGARRIKGYEASEIIGRHFSTFYRQSDIDSGHCDRELETALRVGRFEDYGWRVRKDGSMFWANVIITALHDAAGRHVGFGKVTRDLTDEAYKVFVEATNAIVWTTDGDGVPNADSPSWRAFTGQSEEEWRGLRGWEPVHPDDQPKLRIEWPRAKRERSDFEAEFRMRRKDGVYVWMKARAVPFSNPDGSVREWFGVTFDISAEKQLEEERLILLERERHAREQAEIANRTKDEFLATVSHELRNPLNAILGWARLLVEEEIDPARARKGLEVIARNAKAQVQLVEDILEVSRIVTGKLRLTTGPADVRGTVDAAVETV